MALINPPTTASALRAGLAALALLLPRPAAAADKVALQLNGAPQFEYAGYYAALWQGFYRDAGLAVEIKPGNPPGKPAIDPVREVAAGRAQFGVGGMELVIRAAQGLPLLLLAPVFQHSGAEVYYRADSNYPTLAALAGAAVGRLPASNILDIELATALRASGIKAGGLKSVSIGAGETVAALADRRVDAAVGSAWLVPWQARERGVALKSLDPAQARVAFYGDTLFTSKDFAGESPAIVRRFRAASLKGWDYALTHPDAVAQRIVADLPVEVPVSDPKGFARYQAEVAARLADFPATPLGRSDPARWHRIEAGLAAAGALLRTPGSGDFVYAPKAAGSARGSARLGALSAAALAALLAALLAAVLVRRWPRIVDRFGSRGAGQGTGATDLNAILSGIEKSMRRKLPGHAALRLSLLPELWLCAAERKAVVTAVIDLIAAAAADLPLDGSVVVGTRNFPVDAAAAADNPGATAGDYARLTVRDNGPGLSDTAFERIFDPAKTVRPAVAQAEQMTRRFGGFARVETAEGIGTAVHLYFPRRTGPAAGAAVPAAAAAPARAAE